MANDALQAITRAMARVSRLKAAFELYDRTCNLSTIGQSDQSFTEMVHSECHLSERGIQAALDYAGGEVLTLLDFALDEVGKARREYDRPIEGSAAGAFEHASKAYAHVVDALRKFVAETRAA